MDMDAVRERIEQTMQERGRSAASLSRAIGRNPAYVQQLISGMRNKKVPSPEIMEALARELGVSVEYLYGREGKDGRATARHAEPAATDHALRVVPAPWFDLVEALSRDEEFAATASQIMEIRRTQTPAVAAQAEAQLIGAWRRNAEMWRKIWQLAQESAREELERGERRFVAEDRGE